MFRFSQVIVMVMLVLSLGERSASAAAYPTVATHSGFGQLFVLGSDPRGNLYVADQLHYAILKFSPAGRLLVKDPMPKKCGISGLAASRSGDVYAVANCQALVYHFSASGRLLGRFGKQPPGPDGVAVDRQGHVYVTYGTPAGAPPPPPGAPPGARILMLANRFIEYTPTGKVMRTVKLPGLHLVWGIAIDAGGNVYVTGTEAMVKVSPTGRVLRRWTRIVPPNRKYALPDQPAPDALGDVYATDGQGNILKFSSTGRLLGTIVRHGPNPNTVQQPTGLTVTNGHLFVGERSDHIKEFSLSGRLIAIWNP
jgi:sugar lactone lactonase YvrE